MNIKNVKLLSKISPEIRVIIKSLLNIFIWPLNRIIMGNPNISGTLNSYLDGKVAFHFDPQKIKSNSKDPNCFPIPPKEYIVGMPSQDWYIKSGLEDYKNIIKVFNNSSIPLSLDWRILDFGCSNGRIIRWFSDWTKSGEVWGIDISTEQILWCKQNLNPPFNFFNSTTLPHLPFSDSYFDFIYANSVFTHIDDLTDMWLMELKRILKPNGFLYLTIHDENTLNFYKLKIDSDPFAKAIINSKSFKQFEASGRGMFSIGRATYSQVFYQLEYFINQIKVFYEIVSIIPFAYQEIQTGILVKKN